MNIIHVFNSRLLYGRRLFTLLAIFCSLYTQVAFAHQTPNTIMLLDISPNRVAMELQLPLSELELAFGNEVTKNPETLVQRAGPQLTAYLHTHIHAYGTASNPWDVQVAHMQVEKGEQPQSEVPFNEITVQLFLTPPHGEGTRNFTLNYDVIMHQVMNHVALVSIRNDWESGKSTEQPIEAGVIRRDIRDNVVYPLQINLEKGSWWKGFKNMVALGMQHIKEGTDHLLFLLVLLLPAMLLVNKKRWSAFGGSTYSFKRLLKITTAFTIGHSITLLVGATGLMRLPQQPVEIMIAVSILVSAVHAIYPVFPGKEIYVAAGFGLIHGSAFATVLSNLHLSAGPMALSILGFNLGIEIMQLFIIFLVMPWLMLLSKTNYYTYFRVAGAAFAGVAAMAWIAERSTGNPNFIARWVEVFTPYGLWCIVALAVVSVIVYALSKYNVKKHILIDGTRYP